MNGWDFGILWAAGRAALNGQDPYSVRFFYYPLPMAYLLALIALLPQSVAFWSWLAFNIGLLVYVFRRRFWQWALYAVVMHTFSAGQLDLAFWALSEGLGRHWRGALFAALITLKPQVAIVLLPWHLLDWLRYDRRILLRWIGATTLLWGLPLLWRPDWLRDWMSVLPAYNVYSASNGPGLVSWLRLFPGAWPVIAVASAVVFFWGQWQSREIARAAAQLGSPEGLFYTTMTLLGTAPAPLLVPLSWLAVLLTLVTKTWIPFTMLPLTVIAWQIWQQRKTDRASSVCRDS